MKNGYKTYFKTTFKEKLHKRSVGVTFKEKEVTQKDKVEYHHEFSDKQHPRKPDGSFANTVRLYTSDEITYHESPELINGKLKYGTHGE